MTTPPLDPSRLSYGVKGFSSRFKVFRNIAQVIPSGIGTRVQWNAVIYDSLNEYDEAVTYEFNPLRSGYYILNSGVGYANLVVGDLFSVLLYVNGANYCQMYETSLMPINLSVQMCKIMYLDRGDSVYIETWHNNGANRNFIANIQNCWFEGIRIS